MARWWTLVSNYSRIGGSRRVRVVAAGRVALLAFVLVALRAAPLDAGFVRGDANSDGVVNISDSVQTLFYLFLGGSVSCLDAADANDDGAVQTADAVTTLTYLFLAGTPLPAPFPSCGDDPTADAVGCAVTPLACVPPYPGLTFAGTNAQGYDEYTLDIDPTVVLILIPGGTFDMGQTGASNATPVHQVTLSPYFIAKYEITTAQYRLYCDATLTPYPPPPDCCGMPADHFTNPLYDDHPVVMVSWNDLNAIGGYLEWAGLVLPTEAQWEFAARGTPGGDAGRTYPWGNDLPSAGGVYRCNGCWGYNCSPTDGWVYTSPVDQSPFDQYPGPFGTLGQAGNVWEWCHDWFDSYPSTPQTDPTGPVSGSNRVIRGGSWFIGDHYLPSASRNAGGLGPSGRFGNVGFRPARIIP
ncbi:MAG: formylglycine-generating enzyme family protein [Planctomycetota bacterium]